MAERERYKSRNYHLNKSDEVYIGVLFNGNKMKFVTGIEYDYARWEDGKEAMKFELDHAADIVKGLCFNGYHAVIVDAYFFSKLWNPEKKEDENNEG